MNELQKRISEHKFKHAPGCKFEKEIKDFRFNGSGIELLDDNLERDGYLTMRYCPYCGFDIDISVVEMMLLKERKAELIKASPIKKGDMIYIKKPNNDYWKGKGFKNTVDAIEYQEHSDRLLYQNYKNSPYFSCVIDDIEPYTDQPLVTKDM